LLCALRPVGGGTGTQDQGCRWRPSRLTGRDAPVLSGADRSCDPSAPSHENRREHAVPAIVLVGAQWGDEGKGKATDMLGGRQVVDREGGGLSVVDYVVKFNGGNNAGHTVVIGAERYALHLLPSGILTPGVVPVIGNGVVVDLGVLFTEIDALE